MSARPTLLFGGAYETRACVARWLHKSHCLPQPTKTLDWRLPCNTPRGLQQTGVEWCSPTSPHFQLDRISECVFGDLGDHGKHNFFSGIRVRNEAFVACVATIHAHTFLHDLHADMTPIMCSEWQRVAERASTCGAPSPGTAWAHCIGSSAHSLQCATATS